MNLVYGPNEAGKSSWHAALYAGLCGLSRGRGRSRREDQDFRERHRPWDGGAWQVGAIVVLADGRRVELRHDLNGRVDCTAQDTVLGRDYAPEIIFDGAPDGARWLGLDRRSFLAIACVRQADLLGVLEKPDLLKEYLQRAADSLAQESSVAAAIDRLEQYRKEYVGRDAAGAVKPLRRAKERLELAELRLVARQDAQAEFLCAVGRAQQLAEEAGAAAHALAIFRARRAARLAQEGTRRLTRARELAALHPTGAPATLSGGEALAQRVAAALHDWTTRPATLLLSGETAEELAARLTALPAMPEGDLEPSAAVQEAAQTFAVSERQWQVHETQRPAAPHLPATGGATAAELRHLAAVLSEPSPIVDPALFERLRRAQERTGKHPASHRSQLSLIVAGALALLGLGAAFGRQPLLATVLLVLAALVVLPWLLRRGVGAASPGQEELRAAELALYKAQLPGEELERRRSLARQRAHEFGLSPEAATLERLAAESEAVEQAQRELRRWDEERETLHQELQANAAHLLGMLRARGVDIPGDPMAAFAAYRDACAQRRVAAGQAARRPDLERRHVDRVATEAAAAAALAQRSQAEQQVREAAGAIGVQHDDLECLVTALTAWQQQRGSSLDADDTARDTWTQLQTVLAGTSLEDFARQVQRQCDLAASLASDLDPAALAGLNGAGATVGEPDLEAHEQQLVHAAQAAQTNLDRARGQLEERRRTLGAIAEAEEAVAAARSELDSVLRLDETLALTQSFLEKAQQTVHRSVAPVLAGAVQRRLPAITANRYREVRVDPENLDVQVLAPDGHWRHAALLSHGTAEQIYLLLRVALAQYLTKPGEVCPLILDDVSVHCDRERKLAVLETLREIGQERQVILFSQEEEVLAWAEGHFEGPNDRITRLTIR